MFVILKEEKGKEFVVNSDYIKLFMPRDNGSGCSVLLAKFESNSPIESGPRIMRGPLDQEWIRVQNTFEQLLIATGAIKASDD